MSTAFSVRLEENQHQKLKDFAIERHVSINAIFKTFVSQLVDGKILCLTNEPRITFMAQPSNYQLVQGKKNNGDKGPSP